MRIVHVTRQFHPAHGGMEDVVDNLARRQIASGHAVRVVALDRVFGTDMRLASHDIRDGIEIVRIAYLGSQRYPFAPAVLRHIRDADIVHVHGIDFFFDYLAITAFWHRKTLVVSTHGGFFHTNFASKLKKVFFATVTRWHITRYAYVAASSEPDRNTFSSIRQHGISVIANGVDCEKFSGINRAVAQKRLIYFGRLAPHKNIKALIPLLGALRNVDPTWQLVIAGRPMGSIAGEIRDLSRTVGLEAHIAVIESPSDDDLRTCIRGSSIFVSPSDYEGFGIAAIEALAAGLLPVLSDIPPHRETIKTAQRGLLLDFNQPSEAAAMILAAWSQVQRDGWNQSALNDRLQVYSWQGVAETFDALYRKVLGQTDRRIIASNIRVLDRLQAFATIAAAVESRLTLRVAFVNAHLANEAASESHVAEALGDFCLLNDGIGVDVASRALFGHAFPDNLNGTDFTPALLDAARPGLRLYLLGATQAVIESAASVYRARWPQHTVVGYYHGFFTPDEEPIIARMIRTAGPNIVLVGMGCPRQELWLAKHIPDVAPVGMAIGALFDFQTSKVSRAPTFLRKARLEWVFRLVHEPRRLWKRYLIGNAVFLGRVLLQWARGERA